MRTVNLLGSEPLGIVLMILLIVISTIGDIYNTRQFIVILALLGLNIMIIVASLTHFPVALSHILRKKLIASPAFAMTQNFKDEIEQPLLGRKQLVERAATAAMAMSFKIRVTVEETQTTIFAERGAWNRLGSYVVQASLLAIFASVIWNNYRGYTGWMWIEPGKMSDKIVNHLSNVGNSRSPYTPGQEELRLPFTVEGLDIQLKLRDKNRAMDMGNAMDWITRVRIHDHETGQGTETSIQMNSPFDYRGRRFLQASFDRRGSARSLKLNVTPASGGASEDLSIERNGRVKLSDGSQLHYLEFNSSFTANANQEVGSSSIDYVNPAARLAYLKPTGEQGEMWAFTEGFINEISKAPSLKAEFLEAAPYRLVLTGFEKAPRGHLLQIQYYPGTKLMYAGFSILCLALIGVFFFSHQRLWIVVEDGKLYLGGNANRNQLGFEDRAKKVATMIREPWAAENQSM